MNRKIGNFEFTADQIMTLNPLLVIFLVLFFDRVVYKTLDSLNITPAPLKRIGVGFLFTVGSFVSAALVELFVVRNDGTVHVAWQLPQYILLCIGEVLVSVTSLELAYSQAPSSMKSFMQSYYLLTVSVGNIIVVAVASFGLPKTIVYRQVYEFLFFAGLMLAAFILFVLLSRTFKYRKLIPVEQSPVIEEELQQVEEEEQVVTTTAVVEEEY
jgi:POT family proton-dependent oligopeptide transporter